MPSDLIFTTFQTIVKPLRNKGLGQVSFIYTPFRWVENKLLPRQRRLIRINGYLLQLEPKSVDGIERLLIYDNHYEPVTTRILQTFIKPGMKVVDVGANIGYYTLLLSTLVGDNGSVWAFEPERSNFRSLIKNITLNDCHNVRTLEVAVDKNNSTKEFYVSSEESGEHSLIVKRHCKEVREIQAVRLDSLLFEQIDVLKTDTEGNDFNVLRGAKEVLKSLPLLVVEFWPDGISSAGDTPESLWNFLHSMYSYIYVADEVNEQLYNTKEFSLSKVVDLCNHNMMNVNLICSKELLRSGLV